MTLDEAIKHCEKVMIENLEKTKDRNASDPIAINCFECADEHRQLAEWLKELKQLKEQTTWIPVSEGLPEEVGTYMTTVDYELHGIAVGQRYYHGKSVGWDDDCVIAWQPLPEPYKGE